MPGYESLYILEAGSILKSTISLLQIEKSEQRSGNFNVPIITYLVGVKEG